MKKTQTHQVVRSITSCLVLGCAALLSGCAVGSAEAGAEDIAKTDEPLVADSSLLAMPTGTSNRTLIKMCWTASAFGSGATAAFYTAGRTAAENAIRDSWDANSWVDVTWSNSCSAGMIPVNVVDARVNADPTVMNLNFTYRNWNQGCRPGGANDEAARLSCIGTEAMHEFGHVLAFDHEQNRTNKLGITCGNGTKIAWEGGGFTVTGDWDVNAIDVASIMSYCPEGEWTGALSATDILGLRAVYGGESNGIQDDSKVAVRHEDKNYWQGNGFIGPDFKALRVRRVPAAAGSIKYGDKVRFDLNGKFFCGKLGSAGVAPTYEWTSTYSAAKCAWTVNAIGAGVGGTTVDVNDPFSVYLKIPATQPGEVTFEFASATARMTRVL